MSINKTVTIAIDGPASSGKTTIAKLLSTRLGYKYLNTGAIYRAIGLFFVESGVNIDDKEEVLSAIDEFKVDIDYNKDGQVTMLNGINVNDKINNDITSDAASKISSIKQIREKLILVQRNVANKFDTIIEGRDIGTTVIPDAKLKIFLDADAKVRSRRRYKQHNRYYSDKNMSEEDVLSEIIKRDTRDTHREHSPLKKASDAVVIKNDGLSVEEVLEEILRLIEEN